MNRDAQQSARPCGCDPGANHLCEHHQQQIVDRQVRRKTILPTDPKERKKYPLATGVFDYFPNALAAISYVSYIGNEQHNPGQPLHWAREKSTDQRDTMMRHDMERGTFDSDGCLHSAKRCWRSLAALELEIEQMLKEGTL